LEGGWGVRETKEHDCWFEKSFVGDECGLPFVSFLDSHIVVSPSDIHLCKILRLLEFIEEVWNPGEGVSVSDRSFVEFAIILTWSKGSICYASKDSSWCCEEGLSISWQVDDYEDRLVVDKLVIRE
jgi:hypothetical protein